MNRLTAIMAALGAFGMNEPSSERPFYPYALGEPSGRAKRRNRHNTKKGPGRTHKQGPGRSNSLKRRMGGHR